MIGKAIIFGAGYVIGTKAGHDGYQQIETVAKLVAKRLRESGVVEIEAPQASADSEDAYADIRLGN